MHWNHSVRWLLPVKLWGTPCISNPLINAGDRKELVDSPKARHPIPTNPASQQSTNSQWRCRRRRRRRIGCPWSDVVGCCLTGFYGTLALVVVVVVVVVVIVVVVVVVAVIAKK